MNEVLTKIIHGQTLDIERFESKPGITGLADDSALEEYTYLVAGCVGEFWTKICLLEWPNYARLPAEDMLASGKDFGKALQLVNILRDYPLDLQAGRSYLPVSNLEEIALNPTLARPEWERWRQRASGYLEEAWKYVVCCPALASSVCLCRPGFHRGAHPLLLATSPGNSAGIKVSRSEVRRLMVWAAAIALFPFFRTGSLPDNFPTLTMKRISIGSCSVGCHCRVTGSCQFELRVVSAIVACTSANRSPTAHRMPSPVRPSDVIPSSICAIGEICG